MRIDTTDTPEAVPEVSPELPAPAWRAMLRLLGRLPQGALSRSFGRIADLPLPGPLRGPVLRAFARAVGIDLSEAEYAPEAYRTLNEFFVRRLRPAVRRWPANPAVAACPVDGVTGQVGRVEAGRILQAKGRWYSAAELLADAQEARRFEGGHFVTLYLSPRHYHRVHAPCSGLIRRAQYIPGALLPVNAPSVAHVPDLFARNERLLCYIGGPLGRLAVVAVGAYNVGRISAAFDPVWNTPTRRSAWVTNRRRAELETRLYDPPIRVRQGDELMAFHLGSTVVLLFEPGEVELRPELQPEREVRLGQAIAFIP